MNTHERNLAALFVAQRIEMGESEWGITPRVIDRLAGVRAVETRTQSDERPGKTRPGGDKVVPLFDETLSTCAVEPVTDDMKSEKETLGDLYRAVCGCQRCPLGAGRTTFVFGDGDPHADIMFVGEGPGAEEDMQGLPFVGRAGKLLTRMIDAMKLRRPDVYIGNMVKCRPPGNRDPKPEEIEMCEPILIRQIEMIKPDIICALGRIAGHSLLRTNSPLGSLRGKVHEYHGVKLIVTYHPAALLRNPALKRPAWDDLKFLRREYDGMEL